MKVLAAVVLLSCTLTGVQLLPPQQRRQFQNESKIIGGTRVSIQNYRSAVQLITYYEIHFMKCGGTGVSIKVILTAAHCIHNHPKFTEAFVGLTHIPPNIHPAPGNNNVYHCNIYYIHPSYNNITQGYDVGLVGIEINRTGITFEAAKLPPPGLGHYVRPSAVTLLGWGCISDTNTVSSEYLYATTVPLLSHDRCSYELEIFDGEMLCAGDLNGARKVSCEGDSGGPALQHTPHHPNMLVGVITSSTKDDTPHLTIMIAVVRVRRWINRLTGV